MATDDDCYFYEDDEEEEEADDHDDWLLEDPYALRERRADCWAVNKESLSALQQQDVSMVMSLVNIKQHSARTLLIHHRWKMDRIFDHLERKGRGGLLRDAGIMQQENNKKASSGSMKQENNKKAACGSMKPSTSVTCNVCFEDFTQPRAVSTMDCGHCFCNDCWTEHFYASIDSGKKQIRCMEVKCSVVCDDITVQRLLGLKYPDAAKRFDDLLLESYLEGNDSVRWCPSAPQCGHALRLEADERYREVECPCGVSFCFSCTAPAHSPCPCSMWEKWDAKFHGESSNLKWIIDHTKGCPKCFKPIQKNGGCNHVICRCGQHLCYTCGAAYDSSHSCNRYKEEDEKAKADSRWRQMRRYTHYVDRFKMHQQSHDVELTKLQPAIQQRVTLLQSADRAKRRLATDAGLLATAHRSLLASRQVLSRSFAFAYYMFGDEVRTHPGETASLKIAQNLFEDQQEQLERHVEWLSRVLGTVLHPAEEDKTFRAMQQATNLGKIIETHCAEMYKVIQDELLPLLVDRMSIAAYQPDGPDKAKEFPA